MAKILVIHGPNLNMLGIREPEKYGKKTLQEINSILKTKAESQKYTFEAFQSNSESVIITKIQNEFKVSDYLIINPAAYTHTSIGIRDAILTTGIPFIEVHLSNIYQREKYRHTSYLSDIADGIICGFGAHGYSLALDAIFEKLTTK